MLKNYTSTIPAVRSINYIESKLVACGAKNIMKNYDSDGKVVGIFFNIQLNGNLFSFKLPAKVDKVEIILKSQIKRPRTGTMKNIELQAERTAWKILSDWVDIQMSLIELQQAEFIEIFLPYVYDHNKELTFFEQLNESKFKMLMDKNE